MCRRPARRRRKGTTLVEAAVVLSLFLLLTFGLLDLALMTAHRHQVTAAAQQAARAASVRGTRAATLGVLGPTAVGPLAADADHALAAAARPYLPGLDPAAVTVQAEWPDGGNGWGDRVRVTVAAPHRPFLFVLFGNQVTLQGVATLPVLH